MHRMASAERRLTLCAIRFKRWNHRAIWPVAKAARCRLVKAEAMVAQNTSTMKLMRLRRVRRAEVHRVAVKGLHRLRRLARRQRLRQHARRVEDKVRVHRALHKVAQGHKAARLRRLRLVAGRRNRLIHKTITISTTAIRLPTNKCAPRRKSQHKHRSFSQCDSIRDPAVHCGP